MRLAVHFAVWCGVTPALLSEKPLCTFDTWVMILNFRAVNRSTAWRGAGTGGGHGGWGRGIVSIEQQHPKCVTEGGAISRDMD